MALQLMSHLLGGGGDPFDLLAGPASGGQGSSHMQMMVLSSNGPGSGFMMKSVKTFDAEDPSRNYERTQTTQFGPDGVLEAREQVRDGRQGVEKIGLRRQLGDRYSQVERSRHTATGEESAKHMLHNVDDDDADRFDAQWMAAASRSLPTYRRAHSLAPPTSRAIDGPTPSHAAALLEAPRASEAEALLARGRSAPDMRPDTRYTQRQETRHGERNLEDKHLRRPLKMDTEERQPVERRSCETEGFPTRSTGRLRAYRLPEPLPDAQVHGRAHHAAVQSAHPTVSRPSMPRPVATDTYRQPVYAATPTYEYGQGRGAGEGSAGWRLVRPGAPGTRY
eukprot:GGOE01020102.1.p1 GENE.GGOE01020102.1~~GGOE01020102.1.p1  ORF type:complete len:336 (-),score=36.66 GGOE01020102.1:335-1342(-)